MVFILGFCFIAVVIIIQQNMDHILFKTVIRIVVLFYIWRLRYSSQKFFLTNIYYLIFRQRFFTFQNLISVLWPLRDFQLEKTKSSVSEYKRGTVGGLCIDRQIYISVKVPSLGSPDRQGCLSSSGPSWVQVSLFNLYYENCMVV